MENLYTGQYVEVEFVFETEAFKGIIFPSNNEKDAFIASSWSAIKRELTEEQKSEIDEIYRPLMAEMPNVANWCYAFTEDFGIDYLKDAIKTWATSNNATVTFSDVKCIEGYVRKVKPIKSEFMSKAFTTEYIYTGQKDYHNSHRQSWNSLVKECKTYRIGVELEVVANDSSAFRELTSKKSNWLFMEKDASLPSYGIEFITLPMNPKDAKNPKQWDTMVEYLAKKAKSWNTGRCGLHVHIGREILGETPEEISETTGKLLYFYHHMLNEKSINKKIYGRAEGYSARDGKTEYGNAVAVLGNSVLKDKEVRNKLSERMKEKSSDARYYDINLQNSNTIEFRKGRGSINVDRIISIITYCEMQVLYVKSKAWDKISYDGFVEFIHKKCPKNNPLMKYFPIGESEE